MRTCDAPGDRPATAESHDDSFTRSRRSAPKRAAGLRSAPGRAAHQMPNRSPNHLAAAGHDCSPRTGSSCDDSSGCLPCRPASNATRLRYERHSASRKMTKRACPTRARCAPRMLCERAGSSSSTSDQSHMPSSDQSHMPSDQSHMPCG